MFKHFEEELVIILVKILQLELLRKHVLILHLKVLIVHDPLIILFLIREVEVLEDLRAIVVEHH